MSSSIVVGRAWQRSSEQQQIPEKNETKYVAS
jgi:hypothetical protein